MRWGLSDTDFKLLQGLVLVPLKANNVAIYIFRSRARGTNHNFSDIDLLLVPDPHPPLSNHKLSKIKEDADDSRLSVKVDLVLDDQLADSYRSSVERDKQPIE